MNRTVWAVRVLASLLLTSLPILAADEPSRSETAPKTGTGKDADHLIIDQRLRDMATRLSLDDAQQGKIRALLETENKEVIAAREDESVSITDRAMKTRTIRAATNEKIKALLTPEQLDKWEKGRAQKRRQPAAGAGTPPPVPAVPAPKQ